MPTIAPTNVVLALITLLCLALLTSPFADPRRLAVNAQVERLTAGKIVPKEFDYEYLRWDSGRWGLRALKELEATSGDDHATDIAIRAKQKLAQKHRYDDDARIVLSREEARSRIQQLKENATVKGIPDSLINYLHTSSTHYQARQCLELDRKCAIWMHDFNSDGKLEALVLISHCCNNKNDIRSGQLYTQKGNRWEYVGYLSPSLNINEWTDAITKDEIKTVAPLWPDLRIGDQRLQMEN